MIQNKKGDKSPTWSYNQSWFWLVTIDHRLHDNREINMTLDIVRGSKVT